MFCEKEPMDVDKIEKTLSTIVSSNRVLQHNTGLKILRFIPSLFIHCLKQKNMMNFFWRIVISNLLVRRLCQWFTMYRKRLRIISSMDLLQRTNLVNANTIESKDLIRTSGKETKRDPRKTTSVTDMVISRSLLIAVPQSIWLLSTKSL